MKNNICFYEKEIDYLKKFNKVVNKIKNNNSIYLYFNNIDNLNEFIEHENVSAIIIDEKDKNIIDELKNKNINICIMSENKNINDNDEIKYLYKYQNVNEIINSINLYINNKNLEINDNSNKRILLIWNIFQNNSDEILIKKILKSFNKSHKTLYINITDFENYKNINGLSNIIYSYKNKTLTLNIIKNQIIFDDTYNIDIIHSTTFPEDFNYINNSDLCSILQEIIKLDYEYFIIQTDGSFIKNQYVLNIISKVVMFKSIDSTYYNNLKKYLVNHNLIENNKIFELNKNDNEKFSIKEIIKNLQNE